MGYNLAKIEQNIKALLDRGIDKDKFIYEFLLSFGVSKSIVTRLEKTYINKSKILGNLEWKNKLIFNSVSSDELLNAFGELKLNFKNYKLNPRFIIVTDFLNIYAYDIKADDTLNIPFGELIFNTDFFLPLAGIDKYEAPEEAQADVKAADKMAKLFELLSHDNPLTNQQEVHSLNIFLTRLLFCLFAEDTNLFEQNLFTSSIASHTNSDGSDVADYIEKLFNHLNSRIPSEDTPSYLKKFPYVNGGLFRDYYPIPKFNARSRQQLINCGSLGWSEINPDIFGSMIQAVITPEHRGSLGMHYTSVPNIMKVIKPLFLDSLYEEFELCLTKEGKEKKKALNTLHIRISKIKIFDPACGSGNFLIISYKELRKLEMKIIKELGEIVFSSITLDQFYGIELDDFAHETALLSLWLAEHQMDLQFAKELGQFKPPLPLKESGNIVCGNATRLNWKEICPNHNNEEVYVLGNPPYLGARIQDKEQKEDLSFVFEGFKNYKNLDYIACWFYKGYKFILNTNSKCAFVTTNSICQGQQVALLWKDILENTEISFAYNSFKWKNNAKSNAGVSVTIIGLRNYENTPKYIINESIKRQVKNINAYLIESDNILIYETTKAISKLPPMKKGNMPNDGGYLIFEQKEKEQIIFENQETKKLFKKYIGAEEYINGTNRWCLWIENSDLSFALSIPQIKNRIDKVRLHRLASVDIGANKLAQRSHQFRDLNITTEKKMSIIVPSTTSERREYIPIGFFDINTNVSNAVLAIYDAELWLFGVLTSRMHMVWVRAVAGRLKTDYRYSAQLCYNTFPFPNITNQQKEMIVNYVDRVIEERYNHQTKTLAELYDPNKMPEGLRNAHHELDLYIDSIYRQKPFESDEERLSHLFTMYERMTKKK